MLSKKSVAKFVLRFMFRGDCPSNTIFGRSDKIVENAETLTRYFVIP